MSTFISFLLSSLIIYYFSYRNPLPHCHGLGLGSSGGRAFGFDVHHRLSDPVRYMLGDDVGVGVSEGTVEYYSLLAGRDMMIHGRWLSASAAAADALTFLGGNKTYSVDAFGYLYYANVTVGNPSLSFLVALDTGSDLFWLPCDCIQCVKGLKTSSGEEVFFNIYSPNNSSTSSLVSCKSGYCGKKQQKSCSAERDPCLYQVSYLSKNTSSIGVLVEDELHLMKEDDRSKTVDARVTFGCGRIQTGTFLVGGAPNGLLGLGMENLSVPNMLAKEGFTSSTFSMCFGMKRIGRIIFGDQGSPDQGETPFSVTQLHPAYNITITQIVVGGEVHDLEFTAIFDSGTSFTLLADPAYSLLTEGFDAFVQEKRHPTGSDSPFDYCYELSTNTSSFVNITLSLTMKGGDTFLVTKPIVLMTEKGKYVYCLAVVKSANINIIGQNFMTGYRVVFDRERMVLGWKASNCYDADADKATTLPVNPWNSSVTPPSASLNPESTTKGATDGSLASSATFLMFDLHWCLNPYISSLVFILILHLPVL